jgi:hypothetical protein
MSSNDCMKAVKTTHNGIIKMFRLVKSAVKQKSFRLTMNRLLTSYLHAIFINLLYSGCY